MLTKNFRTALKAFLRRASEQIKSNPAVSDHQRRQVIRRFGKAARNFARLGLLNAEDVEASAFAATALGGLRVIQTRALKRYCNRRQEELGFDADLPTIFSDFGLERIDPALLECLGSGY